MVDGRKTWTDEELLELYKHRNGWLFNSIYESLAQSEKERYEELKSKEKVQKWREEETLIDNMLNCSKEEKEKYEPFISLDEAQEILLRYWITSKILYLKIHPEQEEYIKQQISKITQEQKIKARGFLEHEFQKLNKNGLRNNYKKEIETIISQLEETSEEK